MVPRIHVKRVGIGLRAMPVKLNAKAGCHKRPQRRADRLPSGRRNKLLSVYVDLVHVQAREQRVADGHLVAGGQLAPLRCALDVRHVGDVA